MRPSLYIRRASAAATSTTTTRTVATTTATLTTAALALLALTVPLQAGAQTHHPADPAHVQRMHAPSFGQREFNANCAACHGMDAKGRGPVAGFLTKNPPDLTLLAKQNGGVFPMDRLYRTIDGRDLPVGTAAGPHGNREMPIWGRDYRVRDAEYFGDAPYDADAMVRGRILALLEYMNRLQVK